MHRLLQIQREREGERLLVFRVRASVIKMRTAENREGSGDAVAEEGEEKKKKKRKGIQPKGPRQAAQRFTKSNA